MKPIVDRRKSKAEAYVRAQHQRATPRAHFSFHSARDDAGLLGFGIPKRGGPTHWPLFLAHSLSTSGVSRLPVVLLAKVAG
jgi:hypothetical protein